MLDLLNREREGNWIQTYTGIQFWPVDPRSDEVDIRDIAHALGMMCRYAGHCIQFYSVAEHCYLLSQKVPDEDKLWALLHDATEAYLVDVPRPVKPFLPGYIELETDLQYAIAEHFGLPKDLPLSVKAADRLILEDERQQNMSKVSYEWNTNSKETLGVSLHCWSPAQAEAKFLSRFKELTQ